jgi:5'(3')-deoxyribonucleotidase
MNKLILCDVDDTLLFCANILEEFAIKRLGTPSLRRLRDNYHVYKIFDISVETAEEICQEFWKSELFFNLPPMPCAKAVLPHLYDQGYRFVAISACENNPIVKANRLRNLENAFGFKWEDLYCTHGSEKAIPLAKYDPTIWVEDHWLNCQTGAKLGHKSFLIKQGYNVADPEEPLFTRVNDWYDIHQYITR